MLDYTSVAPFLVLMPLFWIECLLLIRSVPFYRRAISQEMADKAHFAQVDGLRGLLAMSVFFTHAEVSRHFWLTHEWGSTPSQFYAQLAIGPVGMFFLVTGFLFWNKALKTRHESIATFFKHRVRRLVPAYLFALVLVCVVVAWMTGFHRMVSYGNLARGLLAYLTFNLVPGPYLNGFTDAPLVYANVFWSLRIEWMFYLIFPLMALMGRSNLRQLCLLIVGVAGYFVLPAIRSHMNHPQGLGTLGLGTLLGFDSFLVSYFFFGMFAAWLSKNINLSRFAKTKAASAICVLSIVSMLMWCPPTHGPLEGLFLAIPFTLIVYGNSIFGLLNIPPLTMLGQVSYSTYLLHGIVLWVGGHLLMRWVDPQSLSATGFWAFVGIAGMVVVALSAFSYRYFEAPFMKGYGVRPDAPPVELHSSPVNAAPKKAAV